jgi:hypothetical protein
MKWLRLYHETPSDPKLRRIAFQAGTTVSNALAVWVSMMCHAGANSGEKRGTLAGWDDLDCAINLGIDRAIVFAIRKEMEGRTLDGHKLMAWEERQYPSDDRAAQVRKWREKKAGAEIVSPPGTKKLDTTSATTEPDENTEQNQGSGSDVISQQHHGNGTVHTKRRVEKRREERITPPPPSASVSPKGGRTGERLPGDWRPDPMDAGFADKLGLDPERVADGFRDYWHSKPGAAGRKTDWSATWRNWCRRDAERKPSRVEKPGKLDWWLNDMANGSRA